MMRRQQGLLVIVCGGMAVSWIHAWAAFIVPILGAHPFPIQDGAMILALAAGTTSLHQGRGWRIASIIGIQAVGLSFAMCRMVYISFDWADPFWSGEWLAGFFSRDHTFVEWTVVVLTLFWTGTLWMVGARLVVRPPNPFTVSSRFDLGLAAFFSLLLVELIMMAKGVAINPNADCRWSFLAFFMLGLLALGTGGDSSRVEKGYINSFGRIGAVLSFAMLALLFGGGLAILFFPSLMNAAELAHEALKGAARPLVPLLITVLRFVFVGGCRREQEGRQHSGEEGSVSHVPVPDEVEPGLFHWIMTWGFIGMASILGAAVLVFGIYHFIRWLAARTPKDYRKLGIWTLTQRLLALFIICLSALPSLMSRKRSYGRKGVCLYARLQRWGSHCGLPRMLSETPLEYGLRLTGQFPALGRDIALIVDLYNQTVYGIIQPEEKEVMASQKALNRLRSLRHWPIRIKAWILSPASRHGYFHHRCEDKGGLR